MADTVKDPVCGMEIRPQDAAATEEHEGRRFYLPAGRRSPPPALDGDGLWRPLDAVRAKQPADPVIMAQRLCPDCLHAATPVPLRSG